MNSFNAATLKLHVNMGGIIGQVTLPGDMRFV